MPRPFPVNPRGPRRPAARHAQTLLAVPRVSPEWELGALRVLMKPKEHEKGTIRHRPAHQPWPDDARERVETACRVARERLGYDPAPHLPPEGDYFLVLSVPREELPRATAFAVVLSHALPQQWLVLGRLYLKDGGFYRRERGFKLNLVPATNVHLTREMRVAVGRRSRKLRRRSQKPGARSQKEVGQTTAGPCF